MTILADTDRLVIRQIQANDKEELFLLDSDPAVMKYITLGETSSREQVDLYLAKMLNLSEKHQNELGFWAAIEKSTNQFMGWFHFRPDKKQPDETKVIELGYRLKKQFWGQGFATEGSKFFLDYGFTQLEVDEVFAITMKENLASQNVMKKIGMRFDDEFKDEENFPDTDIIDVRYSIKAHQWHGSK